EQRAGKPLRRRPVELALDEQRVDCPADVVDADVALDGHLAGGLVHRDDREARTEGHVRRLLLVATGDVEPEFAERDRAALCTHLVALDLDIALVSAQTRRAFLRSARLEPGNRADDRASAESGAPVGIRADALSDLVGVVVEDPYPVDIHRQLVGEDLSEPGAGALPDAGDADVRDERTVGLGDDPSGLVRPVAALVVAARDTDPDRLAARAPLGPLG